jgi:hypothetical protein
MIRAAADGDEGYAFLQAAADRLALFALPEAASSHIFQTGAQPCEKGKSQYS